MEVVASGSALDFIEAHGGSLYVWKRQKRCCDGGFRTLGASTIQPRAIAFRRVEDARTEVELFVSEALRRLPDELHLELRRRPRRVEAYWNGCVWMIEA